VIITVSKKTEEILKSLELFGRVFVVGCAACATKCQTGSEEAVLKTIEALKKNNKNVTGYAILDTPCDVRIAKRDISRNADAASAEALLVLACGAGIQSIEKAVDKPLIPGLNPVFVGTTERIGVYDEFCKVCGDCFIDETGGICPVSRCAKGLLNGPCGGVLDGKCEVESTRDCVWVLILDKLKKTKQRTNVFKDYKPPRTFSKPHRITK
jgi:hypothetical protein